MIKNYYIQTYGCQMNYHDSERMRGLLEEMGLSHSSLPDEADVIIVNTCAVREKPERKLFGELGRVKKIKERRPDVIIGVTGCMAPRDEDVIRRKAPFVDLLIGPRSLHRLPELINSIELERKPSNAIGMEDDPTPLTPVSRSNKISAWVDVQFGCNFACAYCAVPSARGREVSRPPKDIFQEVADLQAKGYREIMLLGQTVNAYGRDFRYSQGSELGGEIGARIDFTWLLEQLDRQAPGMRIRFTSPHPQFFSDRLISAIADLPSVCEHVHLPMQSADDEVLKRMKRGYTYGKFRQIVDDLRSKIPGISISTDVIVGFPGETEAQFKRTLHSFPELGFDQAFMFIYSPRRHTDAFNFTDEVPLETQKLRLQELIEAANNQFNRINSSQVGKTYEVLVEGPSEKNPAFLAGRTRANKTMIFEGAEDMIGKLVQVKVKQGFLWGFKGDLLI